MDNWGPFAPPHRYTSALRLIWEQMMVKKQTWQTWNLQLENFSETKSTLVPWCSSNYVGWCCQVIPSGFFRPFRNDNNKKVTLFTSSFIFIPVPFFLCFRLHHPSCHHYILYIYCKVPTETRVDKQQKLLFVVASSFFPNIILYYNIIYFFSLFFARKFCVYVETQRSLALQ